jgi:hypothetical protein
VAGCVPQGDRRAKELAGLSLLGVGQIDRVVEAAEATLAGQQMVLLGRNRLPALDLPKVCERGGGEGGGHKAVREVGGGASSCTSSSSSTPAS